MVRFISRKRNKFTLIILISILLLLLCIGFLSVRSDFFHIKKVNVSMSLINCTDVDSIKNSSELFGQNILFLDIPEIISEIKNRFICIRDINLTRVLPDRVNLSVLGREAVARFIKLNDEATESAVENIATPSATANEGFFVDKDGIVFSSGLEQINIPNIYIKDLSLSLGTKLDMSITNALKIIERVKIFNLLFSSMQILNNFLLIFPNVDNPKTIFRIDKDLDTQLASLQLILEKAKIDDRSLEFIDLRFDKPIVRFAPKK